VQTRRHPLTQCGSGQSMVETALVLPLLLMVILNAVNFGYFFLVALNLAAAPRSGAEYSILGYISPGAVTLPAAGTGIATVSYLTYQDITGALGSASSASVQVCSKTVGLNNPGTNTQTARCSSFGPAATFPAAASDPESPTFVLHRVDVMYKFTPLIRGTPFNIALLPVSICSSSGGTFSCNFHRQVSMRALD
jgi:Flp pilus assembly protein TadG